MSLIKWLKTSTQKYMDVSDANPLPVSMEGSTINATVNPDITDRDTRQLGIIKRITDPITASLSDNKVEVVGNKGYDSWSIALAAADKEIKFNKASKELLFINDGVDDAYVALGWYPTQGTVFGVNSASFTFNGTWTNDSWTLYGGADGSKYTNSGNAVLDLGSGKRVIGFCVLRGGSCGNMQIEISSDGTTWQNPSDIAGVTRSDDATGTAMNTYNAYDPSTGQYSVISFLMPTRSHWYVRLTRLTGLLFLDSGFDYDPTRVLVIKSGESIPMSVETSVVACSAPTGSPTLRVIGNRR